LITIFNRLDKQMTSSNHLQNQKLDQIYSRLSVLDLFTLKMMGIFNYLVAFSLVFLALSFSSATILKSAGWIGYLVCSIFIIFIQFRFKKWFLGSVFLFTLLLNLGQFLKLIF